MVSNGPKNGLNGPKRPKTAATCPQNDPKMMPQRNNRESTQKSSKIPKKASYFGPQMVPGWVKNGPR